VGKEKYLRRWIITLTELQILLKTGDILFFTFSNREMKEKW